MKEVSINLLNELNPIRALPRRVLRYLSVMAKVDELPTGARLFQKGTLASDNYYLLSGKLRLETSDGEVKELAGGSTGARFPLSEGSEYNATATCLTPVMVLRLPQDILNSVNDLKLHDKEREEKSIQLEEGGADSSIYMEFYHDMKAGKLQLPSLPDLAMRIVQALKDPNTTSKDIARIIQLDPGLTTRIIGVVNSPAYAGAGHISDCPSAVTRLGHIATRNLAVSFILKNLFKTKSKVLKKYMINLWDHCCRVASISCVLARVTPGLDPDQAMLRGLIHDIGVIPILDAAQNYPNLMDDEEKLELVVNKLKGEIGAMLLREWVFTSDFEDTAIHAEDWMRDTADKPDYTDLIIVAQLHSYIGTARMLKLPRLDMVPAFHKLALGKLTPKHSVAVLDKSRQDISDIEKLLHG